MTQQQKRRGLGKGLSDLGLSELLSDLQAPPSVVSDLANSTFTATSITDTSFSTDGQLKKLPIDAIKAGSYQPRKTISEIGLEELAGSIRKQGVIQPIIVRHTQNHQYEIIAGERRWRAAKLAGLEYIPALIREIDDKTAMAVALIENIQRHDLNAMEEAAALQRLMTEFEMTHQAVADAVGKSRVNVTNLLRLLKLNPDVQQLVEKGYLEMGHARALLTLENEQQSHVANTVVSRSLSVRETEALIRKIALSNSLITPPVLTSTLIDGQQKQLSDLLGLPVLITKNSKNKGKIVIRFKNQDELNFIVSRIHPL